MKRTLLDLCNAALVAGLGGALAAACNAGGSSAPKALGGQGGHAGSGDASATGWADGAGVSYLGWAWNADFSCNGGPGLISDWSGTPTAFGAGLQAHLATVNP